jgi:hypothetical protein
MTTEREDRKSGFFAIGPKISAGKRRCDRLVKMGRRCVIGMKVNNKNKTKSNGIFERGDREATEQ